MRDMLYTWDSLHGEVEAFSLRGEHRGALDPLTGQQIKPAVKGRRVSEVGTRPRAFFDLFIDGQASAKDADDFVTTWHSSGDDEQRPLAEFLGMTDAEYARWLMDRRLLPDIAAARLPAAPVLATLVAERVRQMQAANNPEDRAALFSRTHRLQARAINPG